MKRFNQKVAYLHGLTQGLNVKNTSSEGKILLGVLDALDSLVTEVEELQTSQQDLVDYVETMDEDLTTLEDEVFDDEYYHEIVEFKCPHCDSRIQLESKSEVQTENIVEVTCPHCGKEMEYEDDSMNDREDGCHGFPGSPGI